MQETASYLSNFVWRAALGVMDCSVSLVPKITKRNRKRLEFIPRKPSKKSDTTSGAARGKNYSSVAENPGGRNNCTEKPPKKKLNHGGDVERPVALPPSDSHVLFRTSHSMCVILCGFIAQPNCIMAVFIKCRQTESFTSREASLKGTLQQTFFPCPTRHLTPRFRISLPSKCSTIYEGDLNLHPPP
ncbi:hypothetical protein TorRG33x02_138340 [Trema orientale]|uniref:Uncharacterized protein n=1 Tax=Trema orientale TaxID=63057 RepID=A0A2P5EXV1_TREOI|nr:hypothetical protein TorRG33x02_138340 [Trema orientale]